MSGTIDQANAHLASTMEAIEGSAQTQDGSVGDAMLNAVDGGFHTPARNSLTKAMIDNDPRYKNKDGSVNKTLVESERKTGRDANRFIQTAENKRLSVASPEDRLADMKAKVEAIHEKNPNLCAGVPRIVGKNGDGIDLSFRPATSRLAGEKKETQAALVLEQMKLLQSKTATPEDVLRNLGLA